MDDPPKQAPKFVPKQPTRTAPKRAVAVKIENGGLDNPIRAAPQNAGSEASTSQGPEGAASRGRGRGGQKTRFKPKVVARRKADPDEAADLQASTSAAPEDDAFKALIVAARGEAGWAKGASRGRGRGRGDYGRQNFQSVFGGGAGQHTFAQGGNYQSGASSGAGRGGGGARAGGGSADPKRMVKDGDIQMQEADAKPQAQPEVMLNYDQYYPTQLPMRQPGMEETEAEAHAHDERPPDLSLHRDNESSAAEELGLLDLNPDSERLLLFQLPSLLPVPAPSQTPGGSNSPVKPLTQHEACSLHQLPAGKVGKLLVFESGAVKLQMGDVLLDVAAGTPCQFRQDVAAVNVHHGQFVCLGDVAQRVVCSPNIDQLIRNEAIPDWPRAHMAVTQNAAAPDLKGKGKMNESRIIKQEVESNGHGAQVKQEDEMVN
ncbi:hypothetical protein ABBQ38_005198 [Trebouxia sp. C0009 RCD-2024]